LACPFLISFFQKRQGLIFIAERNVDKCYFRRIEVFDRLNQNAGNVLSATERATLIGSFGSATDISNAALCAQALRQVAENPTLVNQEFNRAFVLMQFIGYLRRNPNDPQEHGLHRLRLLANEAECFQRQLRERRNGEGLHHLS